MTNQSYKRQNSHQLSLWQRNGGWSDEDQNEQQQQQPANHSSYNRDLNPIWHGLFLNRQSWGHEGPNHNFVVIALMIMKFGTGVKLDVFYTMVTKKL